MASILWPLFGKNKSEEALFFHFAVKIPRFSAEFIIPLNSYRFYVSFNQIGPDSIQNSPRGMLLREVYNVCTSAGDGRAILVRSRFASTIFARVWEQTPLDSK